MKFITLALGALAFVGFAVGQGDTTSLAGQPTRIIPHPPSGDSTVLSRTITSLARRAQTTIFLPAPTTPTSCQSGSTLRTGEGFYRSCNWFDMMSTPRPPLECTTTVASYIDCHPIPTGTECSQASCMDFGGTRTNNRFVNKHVATTTLETKIVPTSNDSGGRSQRFVAYEAVHTSNDTGGRSQRYVAREALPTSNDLGGRSQRYVAREALPTNNP